MFRSACVRSYFCLWMVIFLGLLRAHGQSLPLLPHDIASTHFTVTVDGRASPVMHAAMNLYFLNFDVKRRTTVTVTADRDDFWAKGVEVQPWRLGIRPKREGRTISFQLSGPSKITISRPGDFLGDAEMLYLFANAPEKQPPTIGRPGLKYYGPGVHRESINAETNDLIYLAPGAIIYGSLNIWGVDHVKVFGRGVIVYDGPQNPANDDGWMHKKDWHCIVMDRAHDISIEGITCVVRSRTWQIQMKNSRGIRFENFKTIGANAGNANADGMDWLGGGDTVVKDSFFRAADDIFAMQGSWEGYGPAAFAVQGNPVTNITVEDSVLSTSISNVVRAGWPEKNFEGGHFLMRNSDVLHMGIGGCGIPFALMEIWADPNGRGKSASFAFEDIRMEDWYSLVQLMEPVEGIADVTLTDIFGLEQPSFMPSMLKGVVRGTKLDNVSLGGTLAKKDADVPMTIQDGAQEPTYATTGPSAEISVTSGLLRAKQKISFEAVSTGPDKKGLRYEWTFGDGTLARGRHVKHSFEDTQGTLRDGSGRFRVLLHVTDKQNRHAWIYVPVVIADSLKPAIDTDVHTEPGISYHYFESEHPDLGAMSAESNSSTAGVTSAFALEAVQHRAERYGISFSGYIDVPADGGYVFTLLANDAGRIAIDGLPLGETRPPFAQVCGLKGSAVQPVTGSLALAKGRHRIEVSETHSVGQDGFTILWRGPTMHAAQPIPPAVLSH